MPDSKRSAAEIARRNAAAFGKPLNPVMKTAATARALACDHRTTSATNRSDWVAKTSKLTARSPRMKP